MRRVTATVTGLVSVFFLFWFARLLFVTGFLRHLRPGGQGAYIGAVVFPLLAVGFGWVTTRLWRRGAVGPSTNRAVWPGGSSHAPRA
jgi:hypothetical protein